MVVFEESLVVEGILIVKSRGVGSLVCGLGALCVLCEVAGILLWCVGCRWCLGGTCSVCFWVVGWSWGKGHWWCVGWEHGLYCHVWVWHEREWVLGGIVSAAAISVLVSFEAVLMLLLVTVGPI